MSQKKHEETIIYSLDEIDVLAEKLRQLMAKCRVLTFAGPLGAGKTTLISRLLQQCGIAGPITSPTFTYLNAYKNPRGERFYHFDLYRVQNLEDFCAAGFDEYLYQPDSWSLIEWPEVIMPLLDHAVCHVSLNYHDEKRVAVISCKD